MSICLVQLPFSPSLTPALGVTLLRGVLAEADIEADIFYGHFLLHQRLRGAPGTHEHCLSPDEAVVAYELIASYSDLGDHLMTEALWGTGVSLEKRIAELLASPSVRLNGSLSRPGRLARFAARMREFCSKAESIAFIEDCYAARDWSRFDVVGFSTTFCQNVTCLALALRIRQRHPDVKIIFGGANAEGVMGEELLRSFSFIDAVLQGEADATIVQFVRSLEDLDALAAVPGSLFRRGDEIVHGPAPVPRRDMDALPIPDYEHFFRQMPEGLRGSLETFGLGLPVETSRGCWWGAVKHCVFCGLNPGTMTFRSKSPKRALSEIRTLVSRHQLKQLYASDNIIDRAYLTALLPLLEEDGLSLFYETKSNLKESEVRQLGRAGVTEIQPGIESLSSETLALMRKGVRGYQNIELLKWCHMAGVTPLWFYMYGFANESAEPYTWIQSVAQRLWHLQAPKSANPVTVDRYSPYFDHKSEFGIKGLAPLPNAEVYYAPLSGEARYNLSYHFRFELPQGNTLPYREGFQRSIQQWWKRYVSGASFYQFRGDSVTLLLDQRAGQPTAYLLTGTGHRTHHQLRRARTLETLLGLWSTVASGHGEDGNPSEVDSSVRRAATFLKAEPIPSPKRPEELAAFLSLLDDRELILPIDGRYLALAVDCEAPLSRLRFMCSDVLPELPLAHCGGVQEGSIAKRLNVLS